jgi:hypothetical protein
VRNSVPIFNSKPLAIPVVCFEHSHDLFEVEWAGAAAAEDGDLIAAFVDCAIAIERF